MVNATTGRQPTQNVQATHQRQEGEGAAIEINLTNEIHAVLAEQPLLMVSYSGGKDSMAMLHAIHTTYGKTHPIKVVYADTGWEYQDDSTGRWVNTPQWCANSIAPYGYQLEIVRNPKETLLQRIRGRRMFPSPKARFCTSDFKTRQLEKWVRRQPYRNIICLDGRRANESRERSKLPMWERHDTLSVNRSDLTKQPRTVYTWLPIFDWLTPDVYAYCKQHRLELPYQYTFLSRYSCRLCIYNTAEEIANIRRHDPDTFAIMRALEIEIDFTMKSGKSLDEIADAWEARREDLQTKPHQLCMF